MSTALHAFAERRRSGAKILRQLALAVKTLGPETANTASQLDQVADRAEQGRFVVLLIGCFSSGKSTLLNALLGQPVLPVKVNPCTAILTELVYGEQSQVEVRYGDARDPLVMDPANFLKEYQLRTLSHESAGSEARDRFGNVDRAVVSWPLPLLRDGITLLDTPGLDDDELRTARTLASLPEADAVIFVLNASRFLTDLERRTLRRELLPLGLTNLFFPVTMVDLLDALSDDPRRDQAEMRARAQRALGSLCRVDGVDRFEERFFFLNARGALHARWDRAAAVRRDPVDDEALSRAGMQAFEISLERFLVEERGEVQLRHLVIQARRVRDQVHRLSELDRATADASVAQLRQRQTVLEPRFRELAAIAKRVEDTIDAFIGRQQELIWQDLRIFLHQVEEELPDAVVQFDLDGLAGLDLLTPRGRERVEQKLHEQLESWLEERLSGWEATLRPRIERSLSDLRVLIAADAADFDVLAQEIVTDFAGDVVRLPYFSDEGEEVDPVERWFSVAVGAILLSPGTVAAGWNEGYEGALKGAASRLGIRVAIFALGALMGPVGWAGLLLYVVSDVVLLALTGGGQLRRLRSQVGERMRGRLVAQADGVRDDISQKVAEGLLPLKEGLVSAAEAEAEELRQMVQQTIVAREKAASSAAARQSAWETALSTLEEGLADLRALTSVVADTP